MNPPQSDFDSAVQDLFRRYLDAWNAGDFAGYAACFTQPATMILPTGLIVLPDDAAMVAMLEGFHANLVANGFDHSTIGPVTARACNADLAVADLRALRRHRADGSVMDEVDMHYVLRREDGQWRFAVAAACASGWQDA